MTFLSWWGYWILLLSAEPIHYFIIVKEKICNCSYFNVKMVVSTLVIAVHHQHVHVIFSVSERFQDCICKALFGQNCNRRHGLETATKESRNGDKVNDRRYVETAQQQRKMQTE